MSSVGIKDLKNRLSYYIRLAKQGEELVVTERGKPVAIIQHLHSAKNVVSLDARLARLAAQGSAILPTLQPLKNIRPAKLRGKLISRMILEERR
jgi:prevent-host-death family protein